MVIKRSTGGMTECRSLSRQKFSGHSILIRVPFVELHVFAPSAEFGDFKLRVRAEFSFADETYNLSVTDPVIERDYLGRGNGRYELDASYLCVSLGEPYDGYCYKLVATIITRERPDG